MRIQSVLLAVAFVFVGWAVATDADARKKEKRYGIEGRLVSYDDAAETMVIKVSKTKVSGGFGTGRVAGGKPPKSIKRGDELILKVVPEGSVLRRTVVKSVKGGGLNNAGTRESFIKAVNMIPEDRDVVFSFEQNGDAPEGTPAWRLRMIQIRMSQEELEARFNEISSEE